MGCSNERSKFNVFLFIPFWRLLEIQKSNTLALILRAQSFRYVEGQIEFLKCPGDMPTLNKRFIFKRFIIIPCSYHNNVHVFLFSKVLQTIPWQMVDFSALGVETEHAGKLFEGSEDDICITLIRWGTKKTKRLVAICFSWTLKLNEDEKSLFRARFKYDTVFCLN